MNPQFLAIQLVLGIVLTACSDGPTARTEVPQTETIQLAFSDDTQLRIDACLKEAIQQAKSDFGMGEEEIRAEIEGLKSDCAILIESDRRAEQAEASIAQSQARIDAANAEQAAATDEFIRQAEE